MPLATRKIESSGKGNGGRSALEFPGGVAGLLAFIPAYLFVLGYFALDGYYGVFGLDPSVLDIPNAVYKLGAIFALPSFLRAGIIASGAVALIVFFSLLSHRFEARALEMRKRFAQTPSGSLKWLAFFWLS